MQAIIKGTLNIGYIARISIELINANPLNGISLKILHKLCNNPTSGNWCNTCQIIVNPEDLIKTINRFHSYVEYNNLDFTSAQTVDIEVTDFIQKSKIEPKNYKTHYYLMPTYLNDDGYFLFFKLISKANKIAIANLTLSGKTNACAIQAYETGILLTTLNFFKSTTISSFNEKLKTATI